MYGAFECAFHMFACMAQVLKFNIHACVMNDSCKLEWWNENLACIGLFTSGIISKYYQVISIPNRFSSSIFYKALQVVSS